MKSEAIARAVMSWANARGRRPAWRTAPDAYRLAVAEILLQKTKAEDVEPIWARLVLRYPTAQRLARARNGDIARLVAGLGLGRQRTERLKRMAAVMWREGPDALRLPGIGSYGSGLLRLSRGLDLRSAPVDGNVARVIARYSQLQFARGEPRKKPEVKKALMDLLGTRRRRRERLRLLYGLVDLGALVCRPANPACPECPLVAGCSHAREASRKRRMARARARASGGGTASDTSRI